MQNKAKKEKKSYNYLTELSSTESPDCIHATATSGKYITPSADLDD